MSESPSFYENDVSAMYCPVYGCNCDRQKYIDGKIHFSSFPPGKAYKQHEKKKLRLNVACEKCFSLDKETDSDFIFLDLRTIPHIRQSFFRYYVGKKNLQFAWRMTRCLR